VIALRIESTPTVRCSAITSFASSIIAEPEIRAFEKSDYDTLGSQREGLGLPVDDAH